MAERIYPALYLGIVLIYCLVYAPFGINETDGGFLSGLAWQVMCGKTLYQDIIYVRPPLPVWLRAAELACLPENWSVLGERWIFYGKIALYAWLAADLLARRKAAAFRWMLAATGFVVSVHNYPACAWHTVDGILLAVLAVWLYAAETKQATWQALRAIVGGIALTASLLCKQSFYPLAFLIPVLLFLWDHPEKAKRLILFLSGMALGIALFFSYLYLNGITDNFMQMTRASASGAQAFQHGILDYFRINPIVAGFTIALPGTAFWCYKHGKLPYARMLWNGWLMALLGSYLYQCELQQSFAAPFAQSRLVFLMAVAWIIIRYVYPKPFYKNWQTDAALPLLLLTISWSASVSWGYNLPILFASPWVFALMDIGQKLWYSQHTKGFPVSRYALFLGILLGVARYGYEFVYRDGQRSDMTVSMGAIFPKLSGIYSTPEKVDLYAELSRLRQEFGQNYIVLPAFPQAHFLTGDCSPIPLDWVVKRETNGDSALILKALSNSHPFVFIEKEFLKNITADPELEHVRQIMAQSVFVEESTFFLVYRYP
ncbi:MAG: hypothetical protein JNM22_11705 [Saprospiraceae bacterium]|nr:hypothetical protein [Saprospiraceae bacterium]